MAAVSDVLLHRDESLPAVHPAVWHGLAGNLVRAVAPSTEADPLGVLVSLLAGVGACIGDRPHIRVGDRRQPARLWPLLVGKTGSGRKGTSWQVAEQILAAADSDFVRDRIASGLTSGEGLIAHLRDREDDSESDRRLLVIEPELARVLASTRRDGSVLSSVLRQAWESGSWQVLTRHDPIKATGAHLVVVAHITPRELRQKLAETEIGAGFANRFLPVLVERSKLLPNEPTPCGISGLGADLRRAMTDARRQSRLLRTPDAERYWTKLYTALKGLSDDDGRVAEITARGPVYVQRIALLYALLDRKSAVGVEHLRAGAALWQYVVASAERLYGRTGDPDLERLATALVEAAENGLTRADVSKLFNGHRSAKEIDSMAERLTGVGRARTAQRSTGGRPAEVLLFVEQVAEPDALTQLLDESP